MAENTATPIPNHLWELIPEKGKYLRCIIEYCGYSDADDVILLKKPEKLNEMFSFAAEMVETVTNKTELYGPFAKNPEKLCVLPGIKIAFQRFLGEVEQLKSEKPLEKSSNRKRPLNTLSIEDIRSQIDCWLEEKGIKRRFRVSTSPTSINNCTYTCLHCHWESIIVVHEDVACLNFIKNHILNCAKSLL